jgi:hypothetical protein
VVVARAPKALSAALTSRFFFSTYPIHLDMAGLIDWSWTARSLRAPKADARRMFLSAVSALAACLRSNDEPVGETPSRRKINTHLRNYSVSRFCPTGVSFK